MFGVYMLGTKSLQPIWTIMAPGAQSELASKHTMTIWGRRAAQTRRNDLVGIRTLESHRNEQKSRGEEKKDRPDMRHWVWLYHAVMTDV